MPSGVIFSRGPTLSTSLNFHLAPLSSTLPVPLVYFVVSLMAFIIFSIRSDQSLSRVGLFATP